MTVRTIVIEKFQNIDRCLERIGSKVQGDLTRLDDVDVQDIVVLNLQRATQAVIDVAAVLIKDRGLQIPNTLREYFSVLATQGILASPLAERLSKMVGFRNIAVHDYEAINVEVLKKICAAHLGDLLDFQKAVLLKIS